MEAAFVEFARSLLLCMEKAKTMSLGGMLQASVEVEMVHQALGNYTTDDSTSLLNQIYSHIQQAHGRKTDEEEMDKALGGIKQILLEARRATKTDFQCFKATS